MILVTGATGLNGSALLQLVSARGVAARALVRHPAKAEAIAALPHIEIVQGDMARPETLVAALQDVDRAMLISSSDPVMLDVQSNFIAAAKQAGVRHVVKLSGIMPELNSAFRFARMHGEIEQRLEASGMAFTHLRAGEFMAAYFRQAPLIAAKGAMFLPMEDARIASIDVGDIAEIAANVLTGSGHEGKIYPLTGPQALTMTEVAAKLSAATGKTIRYVNVPPEAARQAQVAAGLPPYLADALFELFAERRNGKEARVWPDAAALLGRPPTSFDEFAHRNAGIFQAKRRLREFDIARDQPMKHFMIKYQFANGTTEEWHREIGRFIAAINDDPELKGRIIYRVMKNRDDTSYYHLAAAADEAAIKTLQSRDFFKHYTEKTRQVAGGDVVVTPIEVIAETAAIS